MPAERAKREGCHAVARKGEGGPGDQMIYVYILQSDLHQSRYYVGITEDLRARLKEHNSGEVTHTAKYTPWSIKNYIAFRDQRKAYAFEKYLKSGSGRAFAKRRF
jgi:predicted GIY-YIG superfamily endonuclease